jgi:hypothetical protein
VSHSTKRARRTVHQQSLLCRVLFWALGINFTECQAVLGKEKSSSWRQGDGDGIFAECIRRHSAKKLPLCRVSVDQHSAKDPSAGPFVRFFVECSLWHSVKRASLPSARATTLGKEAIPVPRYWYFAECYDPDTRQRPSLSSVTLSIGLKKPGGNIFSSLHSNTGANLSKSTTMV